MKFSKLKKTVALLVCLTCMLSAMPLNAFATEETENGVENMTFSTTDVNLSYTDEVGLILQVYKVDDLDQLQSSHPGFFDESGNIDFNAVRSDTSNEGKKYRAARDELTKTTGAQNNSNSIAEAVYRDKNGNDVPIDQEVVDTLARCYDEISWEKIPDDIKKKYNEDGVVPSAVGSVDEAVKVLMSEAGYTDTYTFVNDFLKGKGNSNIPDDVYDDFARYQNAKNSPEEYYVKQGIVGNTNYNPHQGIDFGQFCSYTAEMREYIEFCGGGDTSIDGENLYLVADASGQESAVKNEVQFAISYDYEGFLIAWRELNPGVTPEPTLNEFLKACQDYLRGVIIESQALVLKTEGNVLEVHDFFAYESYTYIRDVTFKLTRADGQSIKAQEVPKITPSEFKQKFLMLRDGDYSGQVISKVLLDEDKQQEEYLFEDIFSTEEHRRRATSYIYAYFCLEEWLCEVTNHPLKDGVTTLYFKNNNGWDVRGNSMTLTIDFYKSVRNLSNMTGINCNDIIRNFMSDYKPGSSANVKALEIQNTYTVHSGKIEGSGSYYFGTRGRTSKYPDTKDEFSKYGLNHQRGLRQLDFNYYSNKTTEINRIVEYKMKEDYKNGIGVTTDFSGKMIDDAYWGSSYGPYLGTVHSGTAFESYFNNQKINTKMFKLGDDQGTYGFVPLLVTNRPELSSAYNVYVEATEYTLFMPAKLTQRKKGDGYAHPSWIYYPHREVPAITNALETAQQKVAYWDFRDATEKNHSAPEDERYKEDFEKMFFKDINYYLFFNSVNGSTPTSIALNTSLEKKRKLNLRDDMLVYYSGFAYRIIGKGDWTYKTSFPDLIEDVDTYTRYLSVIGADKHFDENTNPAAIELKKKGFSFATTTDPETGNTYCYAIFGPSLIFNTPGEEHKDDHECPDPESIYDENGVKIGEKPVDHKGHCSVCVETCQSCIDYFGDGRHNSECTASCGEEEYRLHNGCWFYFVPYVESKEMPTMTFNDMHGDVNGSVISKSNGYASLIENVKDLGYNAVNGGVQTDKHVWSWPTTLESISGKDDPNPPIDPINPTKPPIKDNSGGGGGGGGTTPNPYDVTPKPFPTPITPPIGLKVTGSESVTIEDFDTVHNPNDD